jgi:hypothetical protein
VIRTLTTARTRARKSARSLGLATVALVATAALVALSAAPALAAAAAVYDNVPSTIPGNVPSVGYEATSTSEFGDLIALAPGERSSGQLPVTVVMSIWGCETGGMATCATTPGATWSQPLTLNIYAVDNSAATPAVGARILTTTRTFALPYRPAPDTTGHCAASGFYPWYSAAEDHCYKGLAHAVTFPLPSGITLPDQLIWSIAFDTAHHGYSPTGVSGPADSLNVGVMTFSGQPSIGTDVDADSVFLNSTWSGAYGDGGTGGTGTFRRDTGWTGNAPLACFGSCPIKSAAETPGPVESVEGATGTPGGVTPPPTGTGSSSDDEQAPVAALLICLASGALGLAAVATQRRGIRRPR